MPGAVAVELHDAAGTLLATSVDAQNAEALISGFVAPADGPYYARVLGANASYGLVVTTDADFDAEPNDDAATAQDLTATGVVIGAVTTVAALTTEVEPNDDGLPGGSLGDLVLANDWSGSFVPVGGDNYRATLTGQISSGFDGDWDFFKILASPGDTLDIELRGAPSGRGTLEDPFLRLFDNTGSQIAFNDDTFDLDSFIRFSNFTYAGDYYVVADSFDFDNGSYTLIGTLSTDDPLLRAADDDTFSFEVNAGDVLTILTSTPADGPLEFVNDLDPAIELFDPAGLMVESDNDSAPDGRNALITHTAAAGGTYTVRLAAQGVTLGEYTLSVAGHTGSPPPFAVAATDPPDGAVLTSRPTQFSVDFNDAILQTTLDASDLIVDGAPATGVLIVDGDSVVFTFPPLNDGVLNVSVPAGAVLDLSGRPVASFMSTITVDTQAPRVIVSSILARDLVVAGDLVYTAQFNEPLSEAALDPTDVQMIGLATGQHTPTAFDYDVSSSTLTLRFDLPIEDSYTLTLRSGDGRLEDLVGNDLDGERHPNTTVPSGNAIAGGDFMVFFLSDVATVAFPVPLNQLRPAGGLIHEGSVRGNIRNTPDTDQYTIDLDDDQTISVVIETSNALRPAVAVLDPSGTQIADARAPRPGETAIVNTVPTNGPGTYTIVVDGVGRTVGMYEARVVLNAAQENEEHGGASNNIRERAQDIDLSFIGPGPERGAVMGTLPSLPGRDWYRFTLSAGQTVTLALASQTPGSMALELHDADTLLATAVRAANLDLRINNFLADVGGTYYARVAGQDASYSLVVTINADFDTEQNNDFTDAQSINGAGAAWGHVRGLRDTAGQDPSPAGGSAGTAPIEVFNIEPTRSTPTPQKATTINGAAPASVAPATLADSDTGVRLLSDFAGLDDDDTLCGCEPPDTHVVAGPNHVVEVINTAIGVFDKAGNNLLTQELEDLFAPLGAGLDVSDPVVAYDELAGRFFVAVLELGPQRLESDLLYAVSNTSNPLDGFTEMHRFDFDAGLFADYPKIGWNADAHVLSLNMFASFGGFVRVDLVAIDKSSVLDADPTTINFEVLRRTGADFTMAVATMHGAESGDPMWFVQTGLFGSGTSVQVVRMDGVLSASPSFDGFDVAVAPFSPTPLADHSRPTTCAS